MELRREEMVVYRALGGVELRWWHLAFGAEAQVAALTPFQLQVAARF